MVHLWSQRKSLEIINGVIHRNNETPDGLIEHRQILVPEPLRRRFLYWVHGDPTSGHFGVQKTTAKLQHYAYWSGWRRDVELELHPICPNPPPPPNVDVHITRGTLEVALA